MQHEPVYRPLQQEDCRPGLLASFNRYQRVEQCWRKRDGKWALAAIPFEERWDDEDKKQVVEDIQACIQSGGRAAGCFIEEQLVGWFCVQKEPFGSAGQYVNLACLHVSCECRGQGIGKALFRQAQAAARALGAQKLYISGHSSKETQAFYRSVGCREAEEINPVLYEREPYDCHLEAAL